MKRFASTALVAGGVLAGAVSTAGAATLSYKAAFSGLNDSGGAFAALGISASVDEMVFYWSYDSNASNTTWTTNSSYLPYSDFHVEIGGLVLTGSPSTSSDNRITVYDDQQFGSPRQYYDKFQVGSWTDQTLSSGVIIDAILFEVLSSDISLLSGMEHPDSSELAALGGSNSYGLISFSTPDGVFRAIESTSVEISATPIPAALPLLLSALGFFGFMGWRRKVAAA